MLRDRNQTKQSTLMTQSDSLIAAIAYLRRHSSDSDAGIADRISVVSQGYVCTKSLLTDNEDYAWEWGPANVS